MVILDVPYLTQPTPITCQATCLKMFAVYLARSGRFSHPATEMDIQSIWESINTGSDRPQQVRNSYDNMRWWLESQFSAMSFSVTSHADAREGVAALVSKIDRGFPAMVSTNHSRTKGHIILVIGYDRPLGSLPEGTLFVCHDPYGRFDPQLMSSDYGKNRYRGGRSLHTGGEVGPGQAVIYDIDGVRRSRSDRHSHGMIFVVSVT